MAKLSSRISRALPALLAVLLLAGTAPAAGEQGTSPVHRIGDVLIFHRQAWTPDADGVLLDAVGPAYRLDILDVQMRRDAAGVDRPTLVVALTLASWTYTDRLVPEESLRPGLHLLIDGATGLPYGVGHGGVLALGTPDAPPEALRALMPGPLPCLPALVIEEALGRVSSPATLRHPCEQHGHTLTPGLVWRPADLPSQEGELASRAAVEPRAEVYAWTPLEGGAPTRMSLVFPFGPRGDDRSEAHDFLSSHQPGGGPTVVEALAALQAPRAPIDPRAGPFLEDGPREDAAVWALSLEHARRALRESPGAVVTRSYLAAHADAALTTLEYAASPAGGAWTFVWSDARGEGHGVRVREDGSAGRVEALLPAEYADRVLAFPRSELPAASLTVDSIVALARAHLPPAAEGRAPTAFTWTTFARAQDGEESNRRLEGPVSFSSWRASVSFAEGAGAGQTDVLVDVDPRDGRILHLLSAAWESEPVPLTARPARAPPASVLEAFGPTPRQASFLAPTLLVGGAAAASLLGVALTATGREALTRVLVLPLYARVRTDEAPGHPMRRRILDVLREKPGVGVMQICESLGSSQGTVRYHLGVLVSRGYVREDSLGGITGYRLASADLAAARLAMVARHPNASRIHQAVANAKVGLTLREVVQSTGVPPGAAYHHLMRLAGRGLVRVEHRSRALRYVVVETDATPVGHA